MTRYSNLRASIAYFAASPEDQLADDWGADDAVNETPYPLETMLEKGEIAQAEADLVRPFEALIEQYCSQSSIKPWDDEAMLFSDPTWANIRRVAADILSKLPEEKR